MNEDNSSRMKKQVSEDDDTESDVIMAIEKEWQTVDVDSVWHSLDRFGKYQVTQLILLFVMGITLALPILSGLFVGKAVGFKCATDKVMGLSNESLMTTSCSIQVIDNMTSQVVAEETCTEYEYGDESTTLSYIAQWDLVCDKETQGQLPQILTMVGMCVGALTLPQLGDRFGRKKLAIGSNLALFLVSLALIFVEHFELFLILKFLTGAIQQGVLVPHYILHIELMPLELASFVSLLTALEWVLSVCVTGALGYIFREFEWRTMQLAYTLAIVPALLCLCLLDESVRWLLGNSKIKEADAIFRKACRMNKKDYNKVMNTVLNGEKDEVELVAPVDVQDELLGDETKELDGGSVEFKVIAYNKNMRMITMVMCYAWMIASITYYGLILLSTSLAGDPYVNFFLVSVVELPCGVFIYYSMQKFGRKRTLIFCNFVSGAALILAVFVACFAPPMNASTILQTFLTLIGKFFISCSFNIIWIYTPELYPTNLRNIGIGLTSTAGRIGSTFSPLFTLLARFALWAPGVLFSVGCFISVYLLTLIPETRWRELPNDVKEIDQWFEKDKKGSLKRKDSKLYEDNA